MKRNKTTGLLQLDISNEQQSMLYPVLTDIIADPVPMQPHDRTYIGSRFALHRPKVGEGVHTVFPFARAAR